MGAEIRKITYSPKYLKNLIQLNRKAEQAKSSGKLADKIIYLKVNKALHIVKQTKISVKKTDDDKARRLTIQVKRNLEDFIEVLIAENVRNRLKAKVAQSKGHGAAYKGIVLVIKALIKIHQQIPDDGNITNV